MKSFKNFPHRRFTILELEAVAIPYLQLLAAQADAYHTHIACNKSSSRSFRGREISERTSPFVLRSDAGDVTELLKVFRERFFGNSWCYITDPQRIIISAIESAWLPLRLLGFQTSCKWFLTLFLGTESWRKKFIHVHSGNLTRSDRWKALCL